jgi:hypothetical protein
VSFDGWMLALHVLSAFAVVSALVLFWVLVLLIRRAETPEETLRLGPVTRIAGAIIAVGMGGTLLLGIWLAFSYGGHDIWDPWIVAALVLWVVAGGLGDRADKVYIPSVQRALELQRAGQSGPDSDLAALNRTPRGVWLQVAVSVVVLAILVDMIWKPGA